MEHAILDPVCGVVNKLPMCTQETWDQYSKVDYSTWFSSRTRIVEFVLFGIFAWLVCPSGIAWNVFMAYRIHRLGPRRMPFRKYLLSQTTWNILLLAISFILLCFPQLFFRNLYKTSFAAARILKVEIFLLNVVVIGTAGLSAFMAMERILDVVSKNITSHIMIDKRFVAAHWILIIGAVCWTLTKIDQLDIYECCHERQGQEPKVIALLQLKSDFQNLTTSMPMYNTMGRPTGIMFTPVICCIPFLVYIVFTMLRSGPILSTVPTPGEIRLRNQAFSEFMLFSMKFLVSYFPSFVLGVLAYLMPQGEALAREEFQILQHASHFLIMCHAATFGVALRCFQCELECWKTPVYNLIPLRPSPFDQPTEHMFVQFIVMKYRSQRGSLPSSREHRLVVSNDYYSGRRNSKFARVKRSMNSDRYKITL